MLAYLVRRTLFGAATVLGVLLFLFVLFFLVTAPEDIARKSIGEKAQPEAAGAIVANHAARNQCLHDRVGAFIARQAHLAAALRIDARRHDDEAVACAARVDQLREAARQCHRLVAQRAQPAVRLGGQQRVEAAIERAFGASQVTVHVEPA